MAQVLSEMGTDVIPVGCAAIGLAEVENDNVLKDLVAQPALAKRGFNFVHIEGPDRRGIDCALLYNPQLFQVRNVKLVPYVQELKKDSAFYTRGFLTVSGTLANEHVTIIVCHLPSRFSASFYRESGARQIKVVKDSLLREDPTCKVIVMGDMNDDPEDASMYKELAAKENINKVKADEMFNPWYNVHQSGTGTLSYQGAWNLFDQIILSPTLINQNGSKDYSTLKYWKNQIFRRDYMFQTEGKYKGSPKRTTAGGVWLNGYSDHLPTVVYLLKEKK
jgi:endonuclease/exonuclease/phosphatase family metal-dependent hydrolase